MKKKIYVVKIGRKPGIYRDWLDFYEQIRDYDGAVMRSFTYLVELQDAGEEVEGSLAHAMKQAREYLAESSDTDIPEDSGTDASEDSDTDTPDNLEMKKVQKNDRFDVDERLFQMLSLENPRNGNSPWLELLLECVGMDKPYTSNGIYTGRYFVTSLYTGILYLVLNPEKILDNYQLLRETKYGSQDSLRNAWKHSEECRVLTERMAGLEAVDLSEIRYRNEALASQRANSRLVSDSQTYKRMKEFIRKGNHNLVVLYDELVRDPLYRQELFMISGPFDNPDITQPELKKETKLSMQQMVLQSAAISIDLKDMILGQEEAIDKLEKAYFHREKSLCLQKKRKGPRNVFLFAGPPGVGKTLMAECFAEKLGIAYKRFNMAGYSDKDSVEEIAGISTFWKNSKPGVLTSFVKEHPQCVLLFDEIEKAHSTVIRLFLQILDEGACFDRHYDGNISFEDAIIIFTTNAGRQLYQESGNEKLSLLPDSVVIDALRKDQNQETNTPYFPPEIISRMSAHTIIMFNHLRAEMIRKVIKKDIEKQLEGTWQNYGYNMHAGSELLAATIQFSAGVNVDARNASKLGGKLIDRELYEFLALAEEKCGLDQKSPIERIAWEFDLEDTTEEIREFYQGEKECVIAVFGNMDAQISETLQKNNVQLFVTDEAEAFMELIHNENVIMALVSYELGMDQKNQSLSIADRQTEGRELLLRIKKDIPELPVYILYSQNGYHYSSREKQELISDGAEDFVDAQKLSDHIDVIYGDVCCRKAIETMALRHQVLTYETRHELDTEHGVGRIIFYHLKLETAVEAEDKSFLLTEDLRPRKYWKDICVTEDVKKELTFFVDFLQNPREYLRKGVRVPRGVLMYGPPGTGKTSLAKVVATESDINFLAMSADQLLQGGSAAVHRLFSIARKYAPAVLFLDEIDAIGQNRDFGGASAVLNALLTEMDGFKKVDHKPVFLMAATNMGSFIDPALARRFDRTFCVDLPDKKGRRWIMDRLIKLHGKQFVISENELESMADRSEGMSPAALENVVETALRESIRAGRPVDDNMLDEVFEKCRYGEEREVNSEAEIRHTAYHEAGHALVQMFYGRKPDYLSVVARGDMGGYVLNTQKEQHPTKEKLLQRICAVLGGRAAEMEFGYGLTPGASSDLKKATEIATSMVCDFGMYEEEVGLSVLVREKLYHYPKAEAQVNRILSDQLKTARAIIDEHREAMNRLVEAVMSSEKKYLTQKELLEAYHGK